MRSNVPQRAPVDKPTSQGAIKRDQAVTAVFSYRRPRATYRNWAWQPDRPERQR